MRARTAKKKAADGSFVTRPIENGTHGEELIESKLTMENVAAGETVGSLEILGGNDLDAFDKACEIGFEGIIAKRVDAPYRSGRVRMTVAPSSRRQRSQFPSLSL